MPIGEVISALMKYCVEDDCLIPLKDIYLMEVTDETIHLCFSDGNTINVTINKNGERVEWG